MRKTPIHPMNTPSGQRKEFGGNVPTVITNGNPQSSPEHKTMAIVLTVVASTSPTKSYYKVNNIPSLIHSNPTKKNSN